MIDAGIVFFFYICFLDNDHHLILYVVYICERPWFGFSWNLSIVSTIHAINAISPWNQGCSYHLLLAKRMLKDAVDNSVPRAATNLADGEHRRFVESGIPEPLRALRI